MRLSAYMSVRFAIDGGSEPLSELNWRLLGDSVRVNRSSRPSTRVRVLHTIGALFPVTCRPHRTTCMRRSQSSTWHKQDKPNTRPSPRRRFRYGKAPRGRTRHTPKTSSISRPQSQSRNFSVPPHCQGPWLLLR